MVSIAHRAAKKYSWTIVTVLLLNISPLVQGQALFEKAQTGITKGVSAVGKAIKGIDISKGVAFAGRTIREAAQSTASKIGNSLSAQLDKLQNVAPKTIIPKLLENLEKLGQQVGYVANCMFKGTCSEQERAAFIALSITVLALTIALVGFSITVAATSKEIEAKTVTVSEEVKGWSPAAIVTRLKNTAAEFKQNLRGLQTCLLKRQCTRAQKNGLYAFAISIVVLTTIVVGVGIGSYIYAQQKEKERAQVAAAAQVESKPAESKPVLDQMGAYTETAPSWKTKFMQQVSQAIQPIKGAGTKLRAAYDTIQKEIQAGIIKTTKQANDLFEKIVIKANSIETLIKESFDVNLAQALEQFDVLKNKFVEFKQSLPTLWNSNAQILKKQLEAIINYTKQTANEIKSARDAFTDLSAIKLFQAKITSEKEFATKQAQLAQEKEQLSIEKANLDKELEAFYEGQKETETSGTPAKKPSRLQKIKQKLGKKPSEDTSVQIRTAMAEFQKRSMQLDKKEKELDEKINILTQQMTFDRVVRRHHIDQIYPTFITMLNGLNLVYLDQVLGQVLVTKLVEVIKSPSSLPLSGKIGAVVTTGFTAAQSNIKGGIQHLIDGIGRFGKYTQQAIAINPLIVAPPMDTTDLAIKLLEARADIDFIKGAATQVSHLLQMRQPIMQAVNALEQSINQLENAIKNFKSNITKKFVDTIEKSPLTTIPKAPIILFAALGDSMRSVKIALIDALQHSTELLQLSLQVIPDAYNVANEFNKFFETVTGSPFINPELMKLLPIMINSTLPEINEGMKILVNNLQADMPDAPESMAFGS